MGWREGINLRYSTYVFTCFLLFAFAFFVFSEIHNIFDDTLSALKFLKEQPFDVLLLEPRVSFDCTPFETRHYELN